MSCRIQEELHANTQVNKKTMILRRGLYAQNATGERTGEVPVFQLDFQIPDGQAQAGRMLVHLFNTRFSQSQSVGLLC